MNYAKNHSVSDNTSTNIPTSEATNTVDELEITRSTNQITRNPEMKLMKWHVEDLGISGIVQISPDGDVYDLSIARQYIKAYIVETLDICDPAEIRDAVIQIWDMEDDSDFNINFPDCIATNY